MMKNCSDVAYITGYRGELAGHYDTHLEYVEYGGFEKDYFYEWTESCSDYPTLSEIIEFATKLDEDIRLWLDGVEDGSIDSEAGGEE